MELEAILQELTTLSQGRFPQQALEAAIAQREAITPYLLTSLEGAPRVLARMEADEDYMLPFYAFYLLAQFREQRAYPLIVDLFSIPGEMPLNVTGDFVTEDLGRVLASVSGGAMAPMKRLVRNPRINEYTRSAALDGLVCLVANDLQPRDAIITYFQHLLRGGLEWRPTFIWDALLDSCADLHAEELLDDLQRAADAGLFEDFAWFTETMRQSKATPLTELRQGRHYSLVKDTITEIKWWACFQPPQPVSRSKPAPANAPEPKLLPADAPKPAPLPASKVGRNAPCPCGSGKKYKHCCGKSG